MPPEATRDICVPLERMDGVDIDETPLMDDFLAFLDTKDPEKEVLIPIHTSLPLNAGGHKPGQHFSVRAIRLLLPHHIIRS